MGKKHENIKSLSEANKGKKIIVILEGAYLQLIETRNYVYELASKFNSKNFFNEKKEELKDCRPDIIHQCLIHLLESPLNKYGMLQIYIRTRDKQLIYISPHLKIPKTYNQFEALMVTLLRKFKIKSSEQNIFLLKIIKNDFDATLPTNGLKIGLSTKGKEVQLSDYITQFKDITEPVTFFIGAVAYSNPTTEVDIIDEHIKISHFSLSAATCCSALCSEFENLWLLF